jgi:hypothetical protein
MGQVVAAVNNLFEQDYCLIRPLTVATNRFSVWT